MLNEQRIILMTHMSSYEAGEGRKNIKIGNYFRSDYIAGQTIKAIIYGTVVFGVLFGLYILYDFETFMQDLYKMDLIAFARNVLIYYGIFVVIYAVATYVICTYRYARAKKSLKNYYHNLKKLNSLYAEQK